jgi:N,N-dimethylformamidase beta subunit-like protein
MTRDVSRRRFLETAAAAGTAGLLSGCTDGGRPVSEAERRHRAVEEENARRGDPDWGVRQRGADRAVEGFADRVSVLPGEDVRLFLSTTAHRVRAEAFRMGWYGGAQARKVWESADLPGRRQPAPGPAGPTRTVSAAGWQPSTVVSTKGWPEGAYLLRLTSAAGDQRFVPVTVRSRTASGRVLLVNAVATWQAYNTWGGRSLYHGPGGKGDYAGRSLAVSCDRPYDDDGAHLFLVYEQPAIALAERLGVPLAYATSMDVDADPDLLTGARAVVSLGHDEYWTRAMRDRVTAARDTGTNIAFLGANACFRRIRLEESDLGKRRTVVCYKTDWRQDPMAGRNDAAVTTDWREPPHPDPENSLTGTRYESTGTSAAYAVAQPDHWLFEGTRVTRSSRFPHLVGTEYDRVAGDEYTPSPIEILAHSALVCRGVRSYHDSAYYTVPSGAGVFNTGTMRWVESLKGNGAHGITADASRMTRRVTENLLRAFAHERAGRRHPAHDDAAAHHAYSGDPVAQRHSLW